MLAFPSFPFSFVCSTTCLFSYIIDLFQPQCDFRYFPEMLSAISHNRFLAFRYFPQSAIYNMGLIWNMSTCRLVLLNYYSTTVLIIGLDICSEALCSVSQKLMLFYSFSIMLGYRGISWFNVGARFRGIDSKSQGLQERIWRFLCFSWTLGSWFYRGSTFREATF